MPPKNTICIWYGGGAQEAAEFYAKTFPDMLPEDELAVCIAAALTYHVKKR